jgi:hypothetical protein
MSIIKAKPPGQPIPRIDKRTIETITYQLDLNDLLLPNELVTGIISTEAKLDISEVKPRQGKFIEVKVTPSLVVASQYVDYPITILFSTNVGNTRAGVFTIRVHK